MKIGRYLLSRVYISHVTRKHLGILFYSPLRRAGRRRLVVGKRVE
nr:MAG TPA: hypothetical protein [Caudoviricetes sp.]